MNFIKIIIFLTLFAPLMAILSGCSDDSFLNAMKEEVDFISPFDVSISTEESKRTTYFSIPDSGSTVIVETGDDASYTDIPHAINLEVQNNVNANGDDIVVDYVTGLIWTKCTAKSPDTMDTADDCSGSVTVKLSDTTLMEWSKAVSTCKNLEYAGHTDWRLPRLPELLTIVNYKYDPAIDPAVFKNTRSSFNTPVFSKDHFSTDTRTHYKRDGNTYTADSAGEYIRINSKYVYEDNDTFMPDENGDHIRVYIPSYIKVEDPPLSGTYIYVDYGSQTHYIKVEDPPLSGTYIYINYNSQTHYLKDGSPNFFGDYILVSGNLIHVANYLKANGYYILISGNYFHVADYITANGAYSIISGAYVYIESKNRYDYNPFLGYIQNNAGTHSRVYITDIPDTVTHCSFNGNLYSPDSAGSYVRVFIPVYGFPMNKGDYHYDGYKYVYTPGTGEFSQNTYSADVGYWTYSSKLYIDDNFNTSEYAWIVFHQGGGDAYKMSIATYKLKLKTDLFLERQYVRCVRGGEGDYDDVDE